MLLAESPPFFFFFFFFFFFYCSSVSEAPMRPNPRCSVRQAACRGSTDAPCGSEARALEPPRRRLVAALDAWLLMGDELGSGAVGAPPPAAPIPGPGGGRRLLLSHLPGEASVSPPTPPHHSHQVYTKFTIIYTKFIIIYTKYNYVLAISPTGALAAVLADALAARGFTVERSPALGQG